jgi:hypothetical protein
MQVQNVLHRMASQVPCRCRFNIINNLKLSCLDRIHGTIRSTKSDPLPPPLGFIQLLDHLLVFWVVRKCLELDTSASKTVSTILYSIVYSWVRYTRTDSWMLLIMWERSVLTLIQTTNFRVQSGVKLILDISPLNSNSRVFQQRKKYNGQHIVLNRAWGFAWWNLSGQHNLDHLEVGIWESASIPKPLYFPSRRMTTATIPYSLNQNIWSTARSPN